MLGRLRNRTVLFTKDYRAKPLLETTENPNETRDIDGNLPLHNAIKARSERDIIELINRGARPEEKKASGETAYDMIEGFSDLSANALLTVVEKTTKEYRAKEAKHLDAIEQVFTRINTAIADLKSALPLGIADAKYSPPLAADAISVIKDRLQTVELALAEKEFVVTTAQLHLPKYVLTKKLDAYKIDHTIMIQASGLVGGDKHQSLPSGKAADGQAIVAEKAKLLTEAKKLNDLYQVLSSDIEKTQQDLTVKINFDMLEAKQAQYEKDAGVCIAACDQFLAARNAEAKNNPTIHEIMHEVTVARYELNTHVLVAKEKLRLSKAFYKLRGEAQEHNELKKQNIKNAKQNLDNQVEALGKLIESSGATIHVLYEKLNVLKQLISNFEIIIAGISSSDESELRDANSCYDNAKKVAAAAEKRFFELKSALEKDLILPTASLTDATIAPDDSSIHRHAFNGSKESIQVRMQGLATVAKVADKVSVKDAKASAQTINLDERDSLGRTPLMLAAANGHADTAKFLRKQKAGVNHQDNQKQTGLMLAARKGQIDGVKFYLKKNAKNREAFVADAIKKFKLADYQVTRDLIPLYEKHKFANLHLLDSEGANVLMRAAAGDNHDQVKVVVVLLEEITAHNEYLRKSIYAHKNDKHYHTIKGNLEKLMVDPFVAADQYGRNVLHYVCAFGSKDMVAMLLKFLRENYADYARVLNSKDSDGHTPLMLAAAFGREENVAQLVAVQGIALNVQHPITHFTAIDLSMVRRKQLNKQAKVTHDANLHAGQKHHSDLERVLRKAGGKSTIDATKPGTYLDFLHGLKTNPVHSHEHCNPTAYQSSVAAAEGPADEKHKPARLLTAAAGTGQTVFSSRPQLPPTQHTPGGFQEPSHAIRSNVL